MTVTEASLKLNDLKNLDIAIEQAREIVADGDTRGTAAKQPTSVWTRHVIEALIVHASRARPAPAAEGEVSQEGLAREIHRLMGCGDPDKMIHAPHQKSWQTPAWRSWQQWEHIAKGLRSCFNIRSLGE